MPQSICLRKMAKMPLMTKIAAMIHKMVATGDSFQWRESADCLLRIQSGSAGNKRTQKNESHPSEGIDHASRVEL